MNSLLLKLLAPALLLAQTGAAPPPRQAGDCGLPASSRKFDEYGRLTPAEEQERLNKLAAALDKEEKDTKAFIIGYGGRGGHAGDGMARADRARKALNEKSYFINTRLNTLDCGLRETPATEIWLTPAGASPPPCSPTVSAPAAPAKGGTTRRRPRRRGGRL